MARSSASTGGATRPISTYCSRLAIGSVSSRPAKYLPSFQPLPSLAALPPQSSLPHWNWGIFMRSSDLAQLRRFVPHLRSCPSASAKPLGPSLPPASPSSATAPTVFASSNCLWNPVPHSRKTSLRRVRHCLNLLNRKLFLQRENNRATPGVRHCLKLRHNTGSWWRRRSLPPAWGWLSAGLAGRPNGGQSGLFGISGTSFGNAMWAPYASGCALTTAQFVGPNSPNPGLGVYNNYWKAIGPSVGVAWSLPWFKRTTNRHHDEHRLNRVRPDHFRERKPDDHVLRALRLLAGQMWGTASALQAGLPPGCSARKRGTQPERAAPRVVYLPTRCSTSLLFSWQIYSINSPCNKTG